MKPDRLEISTTGRRPVTGTLSQRGGRTGMPTWFGFLFGLPFLGAGAAIVLVATGTLKVDPKSIHAPYWVLGVAGAVFIVGGLMVWGMAARQLAANHRRNKAIREQPGTMALHDFNWDQKSWKVSEWANAAKALMAALGLTLFLSMFNWWAFGAHGPLPVKIIVGIFDLVLLFVWRHAIRSIGCAFKFGSSEVIYTRFPYRLNQPVALRWKTCHGIDRIEKGRLTLRCVEQWIERTGGGKNSHSTLKQDELWSVACFIEQPRNFQLGETIDVTFDLPDNAQSTCLDSDRPVFWELEVHLEIPGLDFKEKYLVPIYSETKKPQLAEH